jgi:oligopeptide/dipeptide ABC transporter ATP-binding protein
MASDIVALDDVSVAVNAGETLGIVGESGSGKTTLSRLLLGVERPTSGSVLFRGDDLTALSKTERRRYRHEIAAVFQNPFSSLDPRMRIWQIVTEQMAIERSGNASARKVRATELLDRVGIDARFLDRYPHQLSGGQRQRVAIARALVADPELIMLDEAISSLDVSIRAQIINLLIDLQSSLGVSYIFIAHDLATVQHLCTRLLVLYRGKVVESGESERIFARPSHPYTAALIEASYLTDTDLSAVEPPRPAVVAGVEGDGCQYRQRCPIATERCVGIAPSLTRLAEDRSVRCHFPLTHRATNGILDHTDALPAQVNNGRQ